MRLKAASDEITEKLEVGMSEIKVGDVVKIAEKVDQERYKNLCGWNPRMVNLLGTEGFIRWVDHDLKIAMVISLVEDGDWAWRTEDLSVIK